MILVNVTTPDGEKHVAEVTLDGYVTADGRHLKASKVEPLTHVRDLHLIEQEFLSQRAVKEQGPQVDFVHVQIGTESGVLEALVRGKDWFRVRFVVNKYRVTCYLDDHLVYTGDLS